MKKISIIIPVYNAENCLHVSVESVIAQTYSDWEIILVEDGSIDGSLSLCEQYARCDKRIFCYHKENEGAGLARQLGIKYATGDMFVFLDADDYLSPEYLEEIVGELDEDTDILICDYFSEWEKIEFSKKKEILNLQKGVYASEEITNSILPLALGKTGRKKENQRLTRALWNYVFSAQLIKINNISFLSERVYFSEDLLFLLNCISYSKKIQYSNISGYTHVYQKNSLSSNVSYIKWNSMENLYNYEVNWVADKCIGEISRIKYMYMINVWGAIKNICSSSKFNSMTKKNLDSLSDTNFFEIMDRMFVQEISLKERMFLFLLRNKFYYILYIIVRQM